VVERVVVRHPLTRAGFFFTLQTLWRSATHRLTLATAAAVSLAFTAIAVKANELMSVQPMVLLLLLAGFRHAARVPGELRASWAFQLSWSGEVEPFIAGVRRAAMTALVCPAILIVLPLHVALLGWHAALVSVVCGLMSGLLLTDVQLLGFRTLPFASSYVANANLKGWVAFYVITFVPLTKILAGIQAWILSGDRAAAIFTGLLVALIVAVRVVQRRQRSEYGPVEFNELPAASQRLDLTA
jgi:hypothetical protein